MRAGGLDVIQADTMSNTTNPFQERNQPIIAAFRANDGRLDEPTVAAYRAAGGRMDGDGRGRQLLLLTTTGARSGQPRIAPLAFTRSGEHYVVIASKGGSCTHPGWYHNLVSNPVVTIEVGAEKFQAQARVAEGAERDRLFEAQAREMPAFAVYQQKTSRRIPVVVLERVSAYASL
jgi:deazaflavin-dependent oxidoreductase (nitroreductase family)